MTNKNLVLAYNMLPIKPIGIMLNNAANTRLVYDAIVHIFACKNDLSVHYTKNALKLTFAFSRCSKYTDASNGPKQSGFLNTALENYQHYLLRQCICFTLSV